MLFGGIVHIIGGIVAMVLLFLDTKDGRRTKRATKITRVRKNAGQRKWIYLYYYGLLYLFSFIQD